MLLLPVLGAGFAAQVAKSLDHAFRRRERSLSRFVNFEAFPNLHAVLGGSLAFQVGQERGFSSIDFAVACMLALILLYDTAGVKRAAGNQAWVLNRLSEVRTGGKPLLEIPGQSPVRTLAAAFFGVFASWIIEWTLLALGRRTW